jgi:hypothetical protein
MVRRRIDHFVTCVMLLLVNASAFPAETQLPFDSRPLIEVHTLDVIPKEVIALLGWHRGGPDGIAERFDKFNETDAAGSNLPRRLLETAGVNSAAVVVIFEEAGRPPTYHAVAFMMTRTGWRHVGDWTLDERPLGLKYFLYTVDSARYPRAQLYFTEDRRFRVERRIIQTHPTRRDAPLRRANLSDDEAREIQSVMSPIYPGAILNISGVVTGCPCEEGPSCSDQVWVVPENDIKTDGAMLSRISGQWTVGPIQKWWLEKAHLEADPQIVSSKRIEVLDSLWEKFPACAKATPPAGH